MTWEPDYVTTEELKAYLRIDDTADDTRLAMWVTTASRAVDGFCHRQFGQVAAPEARTFRPLAYAGYACGWTFDIDDLMDVMGATFVDGDSLASVTGYTLGPENAIQKGKPFTRIEAVSQRLTITGLWGWTAVPAAVKNATLIQASRFAVRRDSPFGIAGSPSEGSEQRLLATLDPDLKTSLGGKYRREWWAA